MDHYFLGVNGDYLTKLMYKTPEEALEIINSEEICFDGDKKKLKCYHNISLF